MKTVFITGTNKGLGLEFTRQYLNEGWNVIATCRSPSTAKGLLSLGEKHPNSLMILSMDLTNEASIKQIGEKIHFLTSLLASSLEKHGYKMIHDTFFDTICFNFSFAVKIPF